MFVNLVMEMDARNITQQYVCHLLFVKLSEIATMTYGKFQQVFGDHAMSTAQAFRWYKIFFQGRILVEDEQRSRLKLTRNSVALVRTRTIPTERPLPVGEVSANFCG